MKKCSTCNQDKDESEFHTHATRGLQSTCRVCRSEYNRVHYQKNKSKYKSSASKHKKKKREFIRGFKKKPCADCGIEYPYYVMQFDHLGDKDFMIGSQGWSRSYEDIQGEINKCDVVCANCHAQRTHERCSGTERDSKPC